MPYYKDKNLLFIHIPKTGGTVIENELKNIYKETLFIPVISNNILPFPFNNFSLQHQFYTTIYKYRDLLDVDFKNIKIFTVVRNPYERIISDLFWYKLIKKNYTSEQVYNIIKNNYLHRNNLDNHNQPQYKFLVDENNNLIKNIKIFKCENLNDENELINDFLGFKINIIQNNVNKDYSKYLNNKSILLINEFYKKDFIMFDYKMKNI